MGKTRLYGNKAFIYVIDPSTKDEIKVGEIEHFNYKNLDELKTYRGLGENEYGSQTEFKGYELSFEGSKVDWKLASLMHQQDKEIATGERSAYFNIKSKVKHIGGKWENYVFSNVTIHGYEYDAPNEDALNEKFMGFCGKLKELDEGSHDDVKGTHTSYKSIMDQIKAKMATDGLM